MTRTGDGDFTNSRSSGQGHPPFRYMFLGQGSSNALTVKLNKYRVSNLKPQGGNNGNSSSTLTCTRHGKKHDVKCLADTDGFFMCGKSG
ncbi:hypothetical protein MTR67_035010 [Solanum verrucosum]|uniref:Uncharacterized protein n=1 Tax=Solanum verrucosum TaxID=315347 RepID=A0AAF0U9G9_SOLVR|nr:hypothetical protein MTR67_035010 [Solanum verrucosum]